MREICHLLLFSHDPALGTERLPLPTAQNYKIKDTQQKKKNHKEPEASVWFAFIMEKERQPDSKLIEDTLEVGPPTCFG